MFPGMFPGGWSSQLEVSGIDALFLSLLVEWDHCVSWNVPRWMEFSARGEWSRWMEFSAKGEWYRCPLPEPPGGIGPQCFSECSQVDGVLS